MMMNLRFPPHAAGPRKNCLYCAALLGDDLLPEDPPKVCGLYNHSGENYHALTKLRDGLETKITYVCQEPDCHASSIVSSRTMRGRVESASIFESESSSKASGTTR